MSDAKHAPGPWRAGKDVGEENWITDVDGVAAAIAFGESLSALRANARLIVAAPDLLAALGTLEANGFLGCVTEPPCGACTCCDARAAIAKAREDQ